MSQITISDVDQATAQLNKSETGRQAMQELLPFLEGKAMLLDEPNKNAVMTLLCAVWGPQCGSAVDSVREAVDLWS